MNSLFIEPHYLGSLEYYTLLSQYETVVLSVDEVFQKQTFRNRCQLLGSNKILSLIVPVSYNHDTLLKEVRVDHRQRWKKDHWGAFYSSYGKSPFFEYFGSDFHAIWNKDHQFLLDLTVDFLNLTLRLLQVDIKMTISQAKEHAAGDDFRNVILPKKAFTDRKIYDPTPYGQLFGDKFIPNLSVIDLLMNEGPQAQRILAASFLKR